MQIEERIKRFIEQGGTWNTSLDVLIADAPDFVEAWVDFAGKPLSQGPLTPKTKALIGLALNAAMTHLHEAGIREHSRNALHYGATRAEILEILQLVSVMAVHACVLGVPILAECLSENPQQADQLKRSDPHRDSLREEFEAKRGYWNPLWETLLALDPEYFKAFIDFSAAPWLSGALEPKVKEFVYIAVAVSATHQFAPGTRIHVKNALGYGATAAELLEVMQLASAMGIQSFTVALPVIEKEIVRHGTREAAVTPDPGETP
ncbi:putative gamma-carboxymuconolactone decarboxylase subunit -like protein [Paraburkholderia caribensis MBA4]|uniref:Putative gamma-carboxymuconolactone decarboxylase subunit-like protein n=1 Tax=Paraburkholderia caribensis MBA4 TaxID=1323664 RepID=A0A0P0RIS0_9BURK|nr:carboxymuconolactone decarboxylase family protein [Paraburkholderia caribensis]ALL68531.1 putative gamma-carboxymuconolactone decarboxylase subunit -like protein [Paraburkholderia caribensis MBA4]